MITKKINLNGKSYVYNVDSEFSIDMAKICPLLEKDGWSNEMAMFLGNVSTHYMRTAKVNKCEITFDKKTFEIILIKG